jgi:hypothetical protein
MRRLHPSMDYHGNIVTELTEYFGWQCDSNIGIAVPVTGQIRLKCHTWPVRVGIIR